MNIKDLYYKGLRFYSLLTRNLNYELYFKQFNTDFLERRKGVQKQETFKKVHHAFLQQNSEEIKDMQKFLEKKYSVKIPMDFINKLALTTQISIKKSPAAFYHGYLLYAAIRHLAKKQKVVNILETGTAKGFSSLCMAKAMDDAKVYGKVVTLDILPVHERIYWNSILDETGKTSRREFFKPWKELTEKYLVYIQNYTDIAMKQLLLPRIHGAFIDAEHEFKPVYKELVFVSAFQEKNDIIVCDDYNKQKYGGVVRAIDKFAKKYNYKKEIIEPSKKSNRKYATLVRK